MSEIPAAALQLQSTVRSDATVELALVDVPVPDPNDDEVLVRIEAAPINPSDMGALFGPADLDTARASGHADRPVITADIPPALMEAMAGRLDQPLPAGTREPGSSSRPARARRRRRCSVGPSRSAAGRCTRSIAASPRRVCDAARGRDSGRRGVVLRQSADRAWHD